MANKTSQKIEASKIVARHAAAGSVKPVSAAAVELQMPRGTLGRWMHDLRKAGLIGSDYVAEVNELAAIGEMGFAPVLPGFKISQVSSTREDGEVIRDYIQQKPAGTQGYEPKPGQKLKAVSSLVDRRNNTVVLEWMKTAEEKVSLADTVALFREAFREFDGRAKPVPKPSGTRGQLLNLFPCNDWHIGMFSWGRETGTNWDLKIAYDAIGQGIVDLIERSPKAKTAVILGGGDLVHADNNSNETAKSHNKLDVDGRHQKVVETAGKLLVLGIDTALTRHDEVIVRILKGNHDEETSSKIAWFLYAWYRNEPRVTIDCDESLFWKWQHGKVMLAATHGHATKLTDMPMVMAHRWAKMWGETMFRYAHGFHVHHSSKYATEGHGVISESHQAPIPQDAWHFGSGFLSGRSLQSITYDARYGEVSRVRVAMLDAEMDLAA